MSYDAGRIEARFVHPGEAAPIGPGFDHMDAMPVSYAANYAQDRESRARRTAAAQRTSRARRLLPLAIAVLAGVVFATLTEGGSQARQAAPMATYLGQLLEKLGLGMSEVTVNGQHMTRDSEIYDRLRVDDQRSIWVLDIDAARKRIETLPWVLKASLKRVFPDRLHIDIRERQPRMIWNDGRSTALLDGQGRILGVAAIERYPQLPVIFGKGAAKHANEIIDSVGRMPELRRKIGLYEWTANRRWTLHLKSGSKILLPSNGASLALVKLTEGQPGARLFDIDFEKLDLRLIDQIAVEFRK